MNTCRRSDRYGPGSESISRSIPGLMKIISAVIKKQKTRADMKIFAVSLISRLMFKVIFFTGCNQHKGGLPNTEF